MDDYISQGMRSYRDKDCYVIGNYQICPNERIVNKGQMIGGVNWDGYGYFPDKTINYDTTSLIFLGGYIDFKERFNGMDLSNLKILSPTYFLTGDSICQLGYSGRTKIASLRDKKYIKENIYQGVDGELYYIKSGFPQVGLLQHSDFELDINTLVHIADDFFLDKNGLYRCGGYWYKDECTNTTKYGKKLESFDAIPEYKVYDSFIVAGGYVYARTEYSVYKLDLDPSTTKEFFINSYYRTYLITDGNKAYSFSKHYQGKEFHEVKSLEGVDLGKEFYPFQDLFVHKKTNSLYMGGNGTAQVGLSSIKAGMYYVSDTGIYTLLDFDEKVSRYTKMFIYDSTTKKYEPFDITSYANFGRNLYTYKGILYSQNMPVKEEFEVDNLKIVKGGNVNTNFVSDGKRLLYNGDSTGYTSTRDGLMVKEELMAHDVDFSSLEVLTQDILMDKNNIYYGHASGLNILPKEKLGIKIEVYK